MIHGMLKKSSRTLLRPYLWGASADISIANIFVILFDKFAAASLLIAYSGPRGRVVGYTVIQPRLQKATAGVDTWGVHNLHGMPGLFGELVASGVVTTALLQMTCIHMSDSALIAGLVVGLISSILGRKETPQDDKEEFDINNSLYITS